MIRKLGKYELLRKLGEGSTSTVYLGRDPFAQRDVAIKVATPEALGNPQRGRLYSKLFLNEASLIGKLKHPHIVQIHDAVVAEKLCYIVMEYVPGGTLEEYAQPGKLLSPERIVEIVFKCSRALDFAFRQGITHRDIKPANILLTGYSDIKISDFGTAINKRQNEQTQVTGIGSPGYMSPEQIQELELDQRTDIYSLGIVLFQLLTGRLPFIAETPYQMLYQIIHSPQPKPSEVRPELPPVLDEIVARAMARQRDERYPNWDSFSRDLAQAVRSRQLQTTPIDFADTEKFDTLRALPFFADFSEVELWEVLRFAQWQRVAAGTVLMRDGEPGTSFCFLAEGELEVSKSGKRLNLLKRGACFGEMAATRRQHRLRSASVTALTSADIVCIPATALEHASASCRMHFYQSFVEVLSDRLLLANRQLIGQ
ncbi:MAG: serine/threonine protein kinase [Rhodocyclales bacterium GT-UBC]|nr:MAG: serine/threonine protein kinase [Rhodocyclales bacterium GT-UBC]